MRTDAKGLTLLEILIATVILSLLLVLAYSVLGPLPEVYSDSVRRANLEEAARRAVEEIARDLRVADGATLTVSSYRGSDRVKFRAPQKYVEEGVVWGPMVQYRVEPSKVDANRNGVADDGRVVRVENNSVRTICHFVPPGALSFKRQGNNVFIRLELSSSAGAGAPVVETSVTLRNRSGP